MADATEWARMRKLLWPIENEPGEHIREIESYFQSDDVGAAFVVENESGSLLGFAEISLRSFAEGCLSRPVPYVEGWFVEASSRRRGIGRALIKHLESWAIRKGYRELASDADPENTISLKAHAAVGFREVGRPVCFHRELDVS